MENPVYSQSSNSSLIAPNQWPDLRAAAGPALDQMPSQMLAVKRRPFCALL